MIDALEYENCGDKVQPHKLHTSFAMDGFIKPAKTDIHPELLPLALGENNQYVKMLKQNSSIYEKSNFFTKVPDVVADTSAYVMDSLMTDPVKLVGYEEGAEFDSMDADSTFSVKYDEYVKNRKPIFNLYDDRAGISAKLSKATPDETFLNTSISSADHYRTPTIKFI